MEGWLVGWLVGWARLFFFFDYDRVGFDTRFLTE